jgi:hypothetical protein
MKKFILLFGLMLIGACKPSADNKKIIISKVEFHLSAFAVESDEFPSIDGYIDFTKDSSNFSKSYYNPAHKAQIIN